MTIELIKKFISENLKDCYVQEANGDFFFLQGDDTMMPFATIVTKDDEYDNVSNLNREGFYRLNIGIDKSNFKSLFAGIPSKPGMGGYLASGIDFSEENKLMPHPVYGTMYWICVVNPDDNMFASLKPYLQIAYTIALERNNRKKNVIEDQA